MDLDDPDRESNDEDEDEDEEEEEEEDDEFDESTLVRYLEGLYDAIKDKHQQRDPAVVPGLKPGIAPYPHQERAAAMMMRAGETDFKGLVIADPPGSGKTLSALMAIAATPGAGRGPSVIVTPSSRCRQWMTELEALFGKDTMQAYILTSAGGISPLELVKYKVIITSYNTVSAEYGRLNKYRYEMEQYTTGQTQRPPKRPMASLLSGVIEQMTEDRHRLGEYLILDEAHAIKNTASRTYAAIEMLRSFFNTCIMMTGTPLENTWTDGFALLSLLSGHPITSLARMRLAFTKDSSLRASHNQVPKGAFLTRLIQMMDAVTLRRPLATIEHSLPTRTKEVVEFSLPGKDLKDSNDAFRAFEAMRAARNRKPGTKVPRSEVKDHIAATWSKLTLASQYAYHPMLPEIMHIEKKAFLAGMESDEAVDNVGSDKKTQEKLVQWRQRLAEGQSWRSARVDVIIDVVNRSRDVRPDDAVLIVDESVYFLDILEIAFRNTYDPVPVFRYDGRQDPVERERVMRDFRAASGCRIMLASRGAGGQGLSIECANVLIRCGPWWSVAGEERAEGRIYRPGQVKPVKIFELSAKDCMVEEYKRKVRDGKDRTNSLIMQNITRLDDAQAPRRSIF
ncbi:hypothetical protein VTK56DRAFT_3813 [Thermocarpiscus australiensis]